MWHLRFYSSAGQINPEILPRMGRALAHRGPDDGNERITISDAGCVAFGHKRLSIIDLSAAGRQPMANEDESVWLTLNGEIYNYQVLRQELETKGHRFRSHWTAKWSCTSMKRAEPNAWPSSRACSLSLCGTAKTNHCCWPAIASVKSPCTTVSQGTVLIFASEIKALLQHPSVSRDLDFKALSKYLSYEYVPAPDTIFRSIKKLEPGHYLVYRDHHSRIARYWDVPLRDNQAPDRSEEDCTEELRAMLDVSVRRRLVADVPVGLFVSGGLDSGIVAAVAAKAKSELDCFSIGFDEPSFDESVYSKQSPQASGSAIILKCLLAGICCSCWNSCRACSTSRSPILQFFRSICFLSLPRDTEGRTQRRRR